MTVAVPVPAVLVVMFGPETDTEVALLLDHVIVAAPGDVADVTFVAIEAVTFGPPLATVTVVVWVTGPPLPCAVIV